MRFSRVLLLPAAGWCWRQYLAQCRGPQRPTDTLDEQSRGWLQRDGCPP